MPQAPVVTASTIDPGASAGLSGWGDGEISNIHAIRTLDSIRPSSTINGLNASNIVVDQCREFLTPNDFSVYFPNLIINRVAAGPTKRGVFIRGQSPGSTGVVLTDVAMVRSGPANTSEGDNPAGFQFGSKQDEGAPDDVVSGTLLRCRAQGFQQVLSGSTYRNGDGFLWEGGLGPWDVDLCSAIDNQDGGFDIKSQNVRLRRIYASGNGSNLKSWSAIEVDHLISVDPIRRGGSGAPTAHLWVLGASDPLAPPTVRRIHKLEMYNSEFAKTISLSRNEVTVVIDWCNLSRAEILAAMDDPGGKITLITNY